MNMGEPPGWNRNLKSSSTNVLINLASLALYAGSGPGGRGRHLEKCQSTQKIYRPASGRTNTRVRKVVQSMKNPPAELKWNQRTRSSMGGRRGKRRLMGGVQGSFICNMTRWRSCRDHIHTLVRGRLPNLVCLGCKFPGILDILFFLRWVCMYRESGKRRTN